MERFPYPDFVEFIPKLPKGLKWSDGVKYKTHMECYPMHRTCWFLPHGDSLYTKNLIYPMCCSDDGRICFDPKFLPRSNPWNIPSSIAVIHDFHSLTAHDVVFPLLDLLDLDRQNFIYRIWVHHGLPLGYAVPTLKNI